VVTDVAFICVNWSCCHAALSSFHYNTAIESPGWIRDVEEAGTTAWSNLHRHCDNSISAGCTSVPLILGAIDLRYFLSQYWMTRGKFPASRGAVLFVSAVGVSVHALKYAF
jgi:hypothetical protein